MENNLSEAREALKQAISRVEEVVPTANLDLPLTLNAVTPFMQTFETTFGREVRIENPDGLSLTPVFHPALVRRITCSSSLVHGPSIVFYNPNEVLICSIS
jgi:hypothetical protein